MILTEEEAKTKRCQEAFAAMSMVTEGGHMIAGTFTTAPPIAMPTAPSFCIGSACMAWRWAYDTNGLSKSNTRGYCGKAGKP